MADFTLALESSQEVRDYNTEEEIFENQASETRLISGGKLIGFQCKSPVLTYAKLQTYITFYDSKYGSLIMFTFNSRVDKTDYNVRFEKGSFKVTNEGGCFQCEFSLKRVF